MTDGTMLHRQIHPNWIQNGRVGSLAFKPSRDHDGLLSVYDGDQITAEESWKHFTEELKLQSAGCLALAVRDCSENDLPVRSDPDPYPEHVVIDFTAFSGSGIEKKAKKLRTSAETRGWQYRGL